MTDDGANFSPRGRPSAATARAATALLIAAAVMGCAALRPASEYEKLGAANLAAQEKLFYGMPRDDARARMGDTSVTPPWTNTRGIGPKAVGNPLDTVEFESPDGDHYAVDRYMVALSGDPRCPFVRGRAQLIPLIYYRDKLVGWDWDYLTDVLQRRLTPEEQSFGFGQFCDPSDADVTVD